MAINSSKTLQLPEFEDQKLKEMAVALVKAHEDFYNDFLANTIRRKTVNSNYSVNSKDSAICVTDVTTDPPRTITLPAGSTAGTDKIIYIKDESGGAVANNITVVGTAGETIDGSASYVINTDYGLGRFYWSGAEWFSL